MQVNTQATSPICDIPACGLPGAVSPHGVAGCSAGQGHNIGEHPMPPRKLPPNDVLRELYESGLCLAEIAERYDCADCTVGQAMQRAGIPRRSQSAAQRLSFRKGRSVPPRYWMGKKQPRELVARRVAPITGPNHYLWKGGKTRCGYRRAVDKEVCARCGATEHLSIHHVNLDHYDNRPENLQVLCRRCHIGFHKHLYWECYRRGLECPKSTGPCHWEG